MTNMTQMSNERTRNANRNDCYQTNALQCQLRRANGKEHDIQTNIKKTDSGCRNKKEDNGVSGIRSRIELKHNKMRVAKSNHNKQHTDVTNNEFNTAIYEHISKDTI